MHSKMEALFIPATKFTPMVDFRPSGVLWIAGNSYPLDGYEFFEDLFRWADDFLSLGHREMEIHLVLHYCNDTFAKLLLSLLKRFKSEEILNIRVFWYAEDGDEDMRYLQEVLEECLGMEFEFLEV